MVLAVTAVTAASLGSAFAAVSYAFNSLQRDQLDGELTTIAATEAQEAPALGFSFTDRPGPAVNDVGPLSKHGAIFDERGRTLSATPLFDAPPIERPRLPATGGPCFDLAWRGQRLRAVVVAIPGYPGRALLLAASRDDIDGDERFLNRAMMIAFLVALAWVITVAQWVARRLSRDHETIALVARKIAGGELSARVASSSSDSDELQLGQDIDAMIETIEQLVSARDRLVAHAAHELRSPLARLYGELQQALRKHRDADGYREAIQRALPAAQRLTALVDDLMLLARARGEQTGDEVADLRQCVAEAIDLVRPEAAARSLDLDVIAIEARTLGHARDLARMARNILENAVAHAPQSSQIRVQMSATDDRFLVEISDQGPGIPADDREKIFEPFYRGRERRAASAGAGLGLSIARDIARAHGGDVALAAPPDGFATCFRASLPRAGARPG